MSSSCECEFEIIDNTERDNEVKKLKEIKVCKSKFEFFRVANMGLQFQGKRVKNYLRRRVANDSLKYEKENKSERGMPRLPEAKKDVVSCEKLRGSANRN